MLSAKASKHSGQFCQPGLLLLWAILVVLSYCAMVTYSVDASVAGAAIVPPNLKVSSGLVSFRPNGFTLVTFLHPQCPCSRATVSELTSLLSQNKLTPDLSVYAVVSRPSNCSDDFVRGAIYDSLLELKNVQIVVDRGDVESRRFGAKTSGQTILFDSAGNCLFSGGITSARGEVGANAGADALFQYLVASGRGTKTIARTPVFGCSLEPHQ